METLTIAVDLRSETGKGVNRRLRAQGRLPGVVYGTGKNTNVSVEPRAIYKMLLEEGGQNKLLQLKGQEVDGRFALIKDYQIDPVSRNLLHVDLQEVDISKKISVKVVLNYIGKSVGVAEGGVLNIVGRQIAIHCLPTAIPKHIDVDVSALKIGDSIHADQIQLPEGIEKGWASNETLVTVVPPTKEEEATASLAPTAEPEVITAKKPEEGAAAADGKDAKKDEKKK